MAAGAFSSSARRETSSMTIRDIRRFKSALAGGLLGALIAVAAFGLIAVATGGGSPWWWIAAVLAGGIGGLAIGAVVAAERDDGEIARARTAKHAVGDADAPLEGGERRDLLSP
jgi:hypothetical protein